MPTRILIIGGYGNFGSYVARSLAPDDGLQLLIAGRSLARASDFVARLESAHPPEAHELDIAGDLPARLAAIKPHIVIHTSGPFQTQGYDVARACIGAGCHYIDLADGRSFVADIGKLDAEARAKDVLVVSGASSVPCLTAAIIDDYLPRFARLERVDYGITAAQHTNRGLGTAAAILSYVGRPFRALRKGQERTIYGWQRLRSVRYPGFGMRLFGDCDVPDLELFPARYPALKTIRFGAGHEVKLLHLGTWLLSWSVRSGLVRSLAPYADRLLKLSFLFDRLGTGRSGLHMFLSGRGLEGRRYEARFFILAGSGHGPFVPCVPAILLARKLAAGEVRLRGATPCLDLIGLDEYLGAFEGLDIKVLREEQRG